MNPLAADIEEILIDETTLKQKVSELAAQINRDYAGRKLLMVGVLKGATMFMVDLARQLDLPIMLDFMAVSSYGSSTNSSGIVRIIKDLDMSIEDKDILLVEDIVDSGLTLSYLVEYLMARNPASLKLCVLLNKPERRHPGVTLQPDYKGFDIPDKFVVGYGLDFAEIYRNLPFIGVLKPEKYQNS